MKRIAILGGGISGLSTAHFLRKLGHDPYLIEKNEIPGGKIITETHSDTICEQGPNTVLMNTEAMVQILNDLDLKDKLIHPDPNAHKNRFILYRNKLIRVPVKPFQVLFHPVIGLKNKVQLLLLPFKKFATPERNENLETFMVKRFGKDVFRFFVSPFVNGIYAGNPEKILAKYALKLIYESESKTGGKTLKGLISFMKERKVFREKYDLPKQLMFTLQGGLGTLGKTMITTMGNKYVGNADVMEIKKVSNEFEIHYRQNDDTKKIMADVVVSTIPPMEFLQKTTDFSEVDQLKGQKFPDYAPVKVFHLAFEKKSIRNSYDGFGVLTLPEDNKIFMGLLFNSSTFPDISPHDVSLFTAFVGGSRQAHLCDMPDNELNRKLVDEIKQLLQIDGEPLWIKSKYWNMGIPQFEKGHENFLEATSQFEKANNGFYFGGNYLRAVSVSECAQEGLALASRINNDLAS